MAYRRPFKNIPRRLSLHLLRANIPELFEVRRLARLMENHAKVEVLTEIPYKTWRLPIHAFTIDKTGNPQAPVIALFGGVHGLERIGTQVVLGYMNTLANYMDWDEVTQDLLRKVKLVFVPMINPGGVFGGTRSNPNGVDLMRNSPIDALTHASPALIYRGHRISPRLPWYRGPLGVPMEAENRAVERFIEREIFPSKLAITVDVHSGFGKNDRIWFPYAKTKKFFHNAPEAFALNQLLDRTHPNHVYTVEPQSVSYTTHGDLWDHIYDNHRKKHADFTLLPLTLEMGSWNWLKKNPFQILQPLGLFHPLKVHRLRRTLRRHKILFDFLSRAAASPAAWIADTQEQREQMLQKAKKKWPSSMLPKA